MNAEHGIPGWEKNVYALAVVQFMSTAGFFAVIPLTPLFLQELGVRTPAEAAFWSGVAQFAAGVSAFLASLVWGAVADRYGRKLIIMGTTFAVAGVMVATGLAPNIGVFIIMRMLHGVFTASNAASLALGASQAPKERVSYAVGVIQMGYLLGTAAGPAFGGLIADAAGYRVPFFITAGILVVGVLIIFVLVRERFEPPVKQGEQLGIIHNIRTVLSTPGVAPLLVMFMMVQFGPFMLQPILAAFMQSMVTQGAATGAGVALSLMGLAGGATSLLVGRLGRPRRLPIIVLVCAFGASVLYLPQIWVQSLTLSVVLFAGLGLCQGALVTSVSSLLSVYVPRERQGAVFGIIHAVTSLAFGTAALTAGPMSVVAGLRSIFVAEAALAFVLGLAAWRLMRRARQAPDAKVRVGD